MSEADLRESFAAQRAEAAAALERVRQRQADAARVQASWPPLEQGMRQELEPWLHKQAETVRTTSTHVSLRRLGQGQGRLGRLRQSLPFRPHLIKLRLRNAGLWLVAYRREIAATVLVVLAILFVLTLAYLLLINLDNIFSSLQPFTEQMRRDLQGQP